MTLPPNRTAGVSNGMYSVIPCGGGWLSLWGGGCGGSGCGGEDGAVGGVEGVEVDVFDGQRVGVVAVEFAAAGGASDVDPVGGAVAGAGEAGGFDEGFDEDGGVAVGGLPVRG